MHTTNHYIFNVSTKTDQLKIREVNLHRLTCSCQRMVYNGFACAHMFACFLSLKQNLEEILHDLIHKRWWHNYGGKDESFSNLPDILNYKMFNTASKAKSIYNNNSSKPSSPHSKITKSNQKKSIPSKQKDENNYSDSKKALLTSQKPTASTGYFAYMHSVKDTIWNENPTKKWTEISKIIATSYKELSNEEREEWKAKANNSIASKKNEFEGQKRKLNDGEKKGNNKKKR